MEIVEKALGNFGKAFESEKNHQYEKMKVVAAIMIFVGVSMMTSCLQASETFALHEVFKSILRTLAQQNHLVTIFIGVRRSDKIDAAFLAAIVGHPHVVKNLTNPQKGIFLDSSAIVSLQSVASLEAFNVRTILPLHFSMS